MTQLPQPTAVVITREVISPGVERIIDVQAQIVLYRVTAANGSVAVWGVPFYETRLSGVTP